MVSTERLGPLIWLLPNQATQDFILTPLAESKKSRKDFDL